MIEIEFIGNSFLIEYSSGQTLLSKGFGHKENNSIYFETYEILYLLEKKKVKVIENNNKKYNKVYNIFKKILKKNKINKNNNSNNKNNNQTNRILNFKEILVKTNINYQDYLIYKDLKSKGYEVKSGLKYGFRFRIYDKGIKKGDDHSLWVVEPVNENEIYKIKDFIGKNRIAHTTRKKMLLGIVDNEKNITYLEVQWKRM